MYRLRTNEFIIVTSCTHIGLIVRSYAFGKKSLRIDEIYIFHCSRDGIHDQLGFYKEDRNFLHPILLSQYVNHGRGVDHYEGQEI